MRVEFVCTNDLCRGPLALAVFGHLLARSEDEELREGLLLASSGVANYHEGEDPDPRMRRAAQELGYVLDHRAQFVDLARLAQADLLVLMDAQILNTLRRLVDEDARILGKVRLLREFDTDGPTDAAVPDPYYGTGSAFPRVAAIVERCCKELFAALEAREL